MRSSILLEGIINYLQVLRMSTNCVYIRHVKILFTSTSANIIISVVFEYPYGYTLPLKNYTGCIIDTMLNLTIIYRIYDYYRYISELQSNRTA